MDAPKTAEELDQYLKHVELALGGWKRTTRDAFDRHEAAHRKAERVLRVLSEHNGVPEPPEGMRYYLVEARSNAGICVLCGKTLEHPYYTADMHHGRVGCRPDDPHPPLLLLSTDGTGLIGRR